MIAYRRLANYPVYVAVGREWRSIVGEWRETMARHLIFGMPATLALLALSLLAMRQWHRLHDTLAQLQDEVRRREGAEEALRQSQKMEAVGRLTGGIAHDFNNHLTVISSNIELLQRRLPPEAASLVRLTEAAMAGVQRAATLTHRLLAFSRQQPLEPEPLDVGRSGRRTCRSCCAGRWARTSRSRPCSLAGCGRPGSTPISSRTCCSTSRSTRAMRCRTAGG